MVWKLETRPMQATSASTLASMPPVVARKPSSSGSPEEASL